MPPGVRGRSRGQFLPSNRTAALAVTGFIAIRMGRMECSCPLAGRLVGRMAANFIRGVSALGARETPLDRSLVPTPRRWDYLSPAGHRRGRATPLWTPVPAGGLTALRCQLLLPLGMLAAGVQPAASSPPGQIVWRGQLADRLGLGPGLRPGLDRLGFGTGLEQAWPQAGYGPGSPGIARPRVGHRPVDHCAHKMSTSTQRPSPAKMYCQNKINKKSANSTKRNMAPLSHMRTRRR